MSTDTVSPLRQRMIEDMNARKLCAGTQRGHIRGCKRFAAFLRRSPETAYGRGYPPVSVAPGRASLSICTRKPDYDRAAVLVSRITLRDWILPPRSITSESPEGSRW